MSKLMMFEFSCPHCGQFEDLVKPDIRQAPCPRCKAPAERIISPVRIDRYAMALGVGATPTAIEHFDRIHRERRAIEDRAFERNGDYGVQAGSSGGAPVTPRIAATMH